MSAELGQPGQIIDGKYRIVRLLGTGGMGAVFEGENIKIRRKVAIKMLHGSVSSMDEVVKRFENEAKAAGMVGSEHICEVLDLGELPDQTRYMVMEYLDGETMSSLIKRAGRLLPEQSIPILSQILDALGAAHAAGIIHRDLKPDNVFILPQRGGLQNFVKILDFGVSKFSQLSGESMNVTRAGAVVGTPYYMSPEQARGTPVDQRTDVYAIGVLLYQATTGQVPFQAETFNELLFKIVLEQAPPPQAYMPDLDPEFSAIIQRAMAREPDQRYPSCAHFKEALLQYQARLSGRGLPAFPGSGPPQLRTEVLNAGQIPGQRAPGQSGANFPAVGAQAYPGPAAGNPGYVQQSGAAWPVPPADGTIPMQPGLNLSQANAAAVPPVQSGGSWPGAVMGAAPPGGFVPSATTNSWGNASSPSNALVKPKSGNAAMFIVVAVAAIVGIGAAVAAVMFMGNGTPKNAAGGTPTATVTAAPTVAPTPATAEPTAAAATAEPTAAAATAEPTATAAPATATPTASAAPTEAPAVLSAKPTGSAPTGFGKTGGFGTKGTTTKGKASKGPGSDLGY